MPSGERYELCRSVHAEMNAIINAGRIKTLGAILYLAGYDVRVVIDAEPCFRQAHNAHAGIQRICRRTDGSAWGIIPEGHPS